MSVQVQLRRDTDANILLNKGAIGEVFVDTTVFRTVVQDNATLGGWPAPITLFVGNNGTVNNSNTGSGAFVNHTPTFTIPANFMVAARAFRVTAHMQMTTGSTAPVLSQRISLGAAVIGQCGGATLSPASQTNVGFILQWIFQATAAPSGSTNVQCSLVAGGLGATNVNQLSTTAQPVAVATNAAQVLTIATQWATAGANQLIVEALN